MKRAKRNKRGGNQIDEYQIGAWVADGASKPNQVRVEVKVGPLVYALRFWSYKRVMQFVETLLYYAGEVWPDEVRQARAQLPESDGSADVEHHRADNG